MDSDVVTDLGLQVALIAALEAAAEAPNFGEDDTKETANMKFRALNNVQLVIKRVHIRYESRGTGGGVGVGAGADAAPPTMHDSSILVRPDAVRAVGPLGV